MVIHETNLIELIIKQMPVFSGAYCNDKRNNILGLKLSPECSQVSTSSLHKTKQFKKKKERKKEKRKETGELLAYALHYVGFCIVCEWSLN